MKLQIGAFLTLLIATPVVAQTKVPDAGLHRIDDGVFTLNFGGVVDLTDKMILLSVFQGRRCPADLSLSGEEPYRGSCAKAGDRLNLKGGSFTFRGLFSDRRACFLDILKIDTTKGVNPSATFRLHCE